MARNQEVMRQWNLLRAIEAARMGLTVQQMADECQVTRRTIYRDLEALQEVGFPIASEARDGHTYYVLSGKPFRNLTTLGFSLSELCALYLSRRLIETLTGVPFGSDIQGAFGKFEAQMPPKMQEYLNRLPSIMSAVPAAGKVATTSQRDRVVEKLVDASLERRQVEMRYFSMSHDRESEYLVYPLRMIHMQGAMYMRAYVPAYSQVRTFATHRIRKLSVLEERFTPEPAWDEEPFRSSLGPNSGPVAHVTLHVEPSIAPIVRERHYHASQRITPHADGSLTLELDVCLDAWLRGFILQFGHRVSVVAPPELAAQITDELELARRRYAPSGPVDSLDASQALLDLSTHTRLPL
jgi:predicted DNA-binding transcriptional regulator YafY